MFYSHTLLARKGPLGTVWSAVHMQHCLKKSQYTATNIPKTVDLIMFPEVPLALRLSGDLLLGVVRIYSKKVDYIQHEWILLNTWVAKVFVFTDQVDLPLNARQAPAESVTLPQALNLDEFDLEDDTLEMEFDNHLWSEEDITLTDQIPTDIDPYVAVTFDEDIISGSIPMDVNQSCERIQESDVEMAYEVEPNNVPSDSNISHDFGTYSPSNFIEEIEQQRRNLTDEHNPNTGKSYANSPGNVPEIEKRPAPDLSPASYPSFERNESLNTTLNVNLTIPSSEEEHHNVVHPSPLALQPSPPPQQQTRPRKRKRFDKVVVLTNRTMNERINDPSDTLRNRRNMPSSKVNIWRLTNQSKKDQTFNNPLFTGFSNDLRSVFEKDYVASKPYLAVSDETSPGPASVSSPHQEAETEINPTSSIPQSIIVPDSSNPISTAPRSPARQTEDVQGLAGPRPVHAESIATEAHSPQTFNDYDMGIEHLRGGFTTHSGTWERRSYGTEPSSTSTIPEDQPELSPVSEMTDEELNFLQDGGNTPVRSPASQDSDGLTGRSRGLAQYLEQRLSSTPTSNHPCGDLSLSEILAGKRRKIAARMFFETLVLKSRGVIDMQQNKPYGDIALKLLPALFSKVINHE